MTIWWVDSLSEAARKAFDAMDLKKYEYKTEFARKYLAQGLREGLAQGLLQLLAARGVEVPDAIRTQILACTDPAVLHRWIQRAASAATAAQVVDGE